MLREWYSKPIKTLVQVSSSNSNQKKTTFHTPLKKGRPEFILSLKGYEAKPRNGDKSLHLRKAKPSFPFQLRFLQLI